jgi:hypothetical protein
MVAVYQNNWYDRRPGKVRMNLAERVIAKFGSQSALAALLGKGQSTVQHWAKTGSIPSRWHQTLLALAAEHGIDLSPSDLVATAAPSPSASPPGRPQALWAGALNHGDASLPCYVLNDGRRVMSQRAATEVLTSGKGGGNLKSYTGTEALSGYMPKDLSDQMIEFEIPGNPTPGQGMQAETFLEICRAFVRARDENALKTSRQIEIAIKAGMFLAACANVGLIALIDEATGYQYERAEDALQVKLSLFLEEEMRKWERTFPEELWREFGKLTGWKGAIHQRPKYWGKLVMELIYGYLDKDVAQWLKTNAPAPRKGQNYHQWLSSQYGLKKLIEHIWFTVGMASGCQSMSELREKMAVKFGREKVQLLLYLPPAAVGKKRPLVPQNDN